MSERPHILILAGPNGAGKSTAQPFLVPPDMPFVNADNIAHDLRNAGSPTGPATDLAAGRLLIREMERLTESRQSFCTETNLANRSLAQRLPIWQALGFTIGLYYLWVPSPDFAVARVALRVTKGGHDVPEATVRRRYCQGLRNFFEVYVPLADRWRLYDSSQPGTPILLERGMRQVRDRDAWQTIRAIAFSQETRHAAQ